MNVSCTLCCGRFKRTALHKLKVRTPFPPTWPLLSFVYFTIAYCFSTFLPSICIRFSFNTVVFFCLCCCHTEYCFLCLLHCGRSNSR